MHRFMFAAAAAMLASVPASAVIVSGALTGGTIVSNGGSFQVTTLSNITVNTINSANVLGINEAQNYTLVSDVRVINVDTPSGTTIANTLAGYGPKTGLITAGTKVNSHMIILDPTDGSGSRSATGTVTFNAQILGYIVHTVGRGGANFTATNFLGAPGTSYGALHSSLEGGVDGFSFSGMGGTTLTFGMTSTRNVGDFVRVITAVPVTPPGIPEPRSWAMLLAGFGLIGFGMRRRRAAAAA